MSSLDLARAEPLGVPFAHPNASFGAIDPDTAALVVAAAGDVAFVVDADGIIRDIAVSTPGMERDGFAKFAGQAWIETVAGESRVKVTEMLADAAKRIAPRWRELNHPVGDGGMIAVRYIAVGTNRPDGRAIVIGRDMRATAALQQRLLQAQQSMERDYMRLRQAEQRYRLLFDVATEAVLIVDSNTRRITEANPAAQRLCGTTEGALAGQMLVSLIAPSARAQVGDLLGAVAAAATPPPLRTSLDDGGASCMISATLFRQDSSTYFLVRLVAETAVHALAPDAAQQALSELVERLPDAFVVTDAGLNILTENAAFLDLTQLARREQAHGQPLSRFLGRPGIDLNVLVANLREHGAVRNFATIVRSQYQAQEDVEVSAVATEGALPGFGFSIRSVGRRLADRPAPGIEAPRSVEQLTELVGRVSLKEIVRESTDLIERLCIEAALNFTSDNRASAAEILGLSRQSLYSKLHRHGLGNLVAGDDGD